MDYAKTLARIAGMSVKAGDERTNIETITCEAAGLFNTGLASIFRYDRDRAALKQIASFGLPPHLVRKLEEAGNRSWTTSFLGDSAYPIVIDNARKNAPNDEIRTWAALLDATTLTIAPLKHESKLLGMLVLYHQTPYSYSAEECDVLKTLAALTATVVARTATADGETSESLKSHLFSVLSHELRTPLTSIMGFTQLIRKRVSASGNADQRLMEQLDVLWAQAQRLSRLIDTFVDMSRIERGEFEITRGQVELTAMLRAASSQAVAQASSRHMVDVDVPDAPVWLHGDHKRLEQVFSHVISNAVRYSPNDQPIVVSCKQEPGDGNVTVRVTDNGPGIPAARLREIFDRNYPSGPLKSGGLGVGLYLSKVIVEAHGGQIAVESTSGDGTTVAILLPV